MTPKSLSCVIRSNQSANELSTTVALASETGAHLSVAVVGVALPPPSTVAYAMAVDIWADGHSELQESIREKADEIEAMLQKAEISAGVSQHYLMEGAIAGLVGLHARYSDMAIVSPTTAENRHFRERVLKGLTFESGIPFLVLPESATPTLKPNSVVIAWRGTLEASRAVHAAIDLMAGAKSVVVAMVDPQENQWDSGEEPGFDIGSFLARHGIRVEVERIAGGGREPGEVLMRCARDRNADMLVMGAYGHSRLREYVLGGTTRYMLDHAPLPVLMMH